MDRKTALIETLNLEPHPEGGYYKEVYRSNGSISIPESSDYPDGRAYSTSIYYLLGRDDFSAFHRIKSDEVWHHYEGSAANIYIIRTDGTLQILRLGKNLNNNEAPQLIMPADNWFSVTVETDDPDGYLLAGCTVSPGFDFRDFEMADRKTLLKSYPEHSDLISRLCTD